VTTRPLSIRFKTIAALVVVAMVPSIILTFVWYRASVSGLLRTVNGGLVAAASRSAAAMDGALNAGLDAIRTQAQLASVRRALLTPNEETQREAREVLVSLSRSNVLDIAAYALLDSAGRVVLSSNGTLARGEQVTDPIVLGALRSLVPVMTPLRYRADDPTSASYILAAPVRVDARGLGVLMVEYESAALQRNLLAQLRTLGSTAQSILYDERSVRLAGTIEPGALFRTTNPLPDSVRRALIDARRLRPDSAGGMGLPVTRRVRNLRTNADSTLTYDVLQQVGSGPVVAYLSASAPLRVQPWRISVETERNAVLGEPMGALVRDSALLALLFVLAAVLSAIIIARRLTRPLVALTETSRRFADGELEARVEVRSDDEIGRLAAAFNDLADRVGSLVGRLAHRTKQLEEDIAERERLESELVRTRKLEAVGKLAGGIAHDFNNLLTVISQNAELALEEARGAPHLTEALQDIGDAADRGAALTRQLLTFARRGRSSPRVMDVAEAVRSAERLIRQLLGSHITLHLQLEGGPLAVEIDPVQFEQVLLNLVSNARDAMPRGGTLRIRAHADRDGAALDRVPAVLLDVEDSGEGMSAETAARVFEPFFTTREAGRGTGLGLSTVYGIVSQAGGRVTLTTSLGQGTTVRVALPLHVGPIAAVELADVPRAERSNGSGTILVVEDEPAVRHATSRSLRRLGYVVLEAGDGLQGLALGRLYRDDIDLLVTDVVMPGSDGYSIAATLAAEIPTLRVLLVSGYSADARAHFGADAPDFPILEKPYTLDALARAVARLLEQSP